MRKKERFCKYGHDTSIYGRDKNRACVKCKEERRALKPTKSSVKQFCVYGHEITIVGRYANGNCIGCAKEGHKNPIKQFCKRGHDTFVTGRTKTNNCVVCEQIRHKKYREEHQEEVKIQSKEYYSINKERIKIINRIAHLKRNYGISVEDYNEMLKKQNDVCIGCLRSADKSGHIVLDVDHNHKTGKIRGLLCRDCNTSLGKLLNNPDILRRLADYLENDGV